ncbi:MAG: glycosyltransferase [Gemmatimonadota bacterium]
MIRAPLRILHIDSARVWRGGQNQVRLLARGIGRRSDVVQAVAAREGSRLASALREAGVEVRPLVWASGTDPRALRTLAREMRRQWDIVHVHDAHALQMALFALSLEGASARLIASRRLSLPLRSPWMWRRADLILAPTETVRDSLLAQGIEARRVRAVHDGIDPEELLPQRPGRLREAARASPGEFLVGSVGALDRSKDHTTLVRAAARVREERPDVRFVVIGEGPERGRLERAVTALGLDGAFAFPGYLSNARLSVSDLDAFVMPSRHAGVGTASLEAMCLGVPVVLSRAGGLAELAGNEITTFAPGDDAALARRILALAGDPAARERAAAASRARAAEFGARRMVRRTLDCYGAVLGRRRT